MVIISNNHWSLSFKKDNTHFCGYCKGNYLCFGDIWGISYGERLKEERSRLGFSQKVLAEKAEIAYNTYSNYELGKRSPDADTLIKLWYLGIDIFYLLTNQKSVVAENYEERALLKMFRNLNGDEKRSVLMKLERMEIDTLAFSGKSAVEQPRVQVFDSNEGNHNTVGNVAGRDINIGKK